jgi:Zn-dependent M28 family amino/carboxypeptidase
MKKIITLLLVGFVLSSCGSSKSSRLNDDEIKSKYAATIIRSDLETRLYILASAVLEGRQTGEKGQKLAANYIADFYDHLQLSSPEGYENYMQEIPKEYFRGKSKASSENVMAFIAGSEFPEEVIIISAHYDHLGKKGDLIYYGADDNASGTSAVLEIAQAFQEAKKSGYGPKRSILFLNLTGEEDGLFGSKYYVSHPVYPLEETVVDLNIDMIGRVDEKHKDQPDYLYLIGSDKLSKELHKLSEAINKDYFGLELDYTYNDEKDPNRFYERSDHYNFAKNNIPIIFYFNGAHEDYHKATDTPDKINYDLLAKRTKLIFYTAWEIANREFRITVDKKKE